MERRLLSPTSKSPQSLPEVVGYGALIGLAGGMLFALMHFPGMMAGEAGKAGLQAAGFGMALAKGISYLQGKATYEVMPINIAAAGFGLGGLIGALIAGGGSLLVGVLAALFGGASIAMACAEGPGRLILGGAAAAGFFATALIRWGFGMALGTTITLGLVNAVVYLLPFLVAGTVAAAGLYFTGTPHSASSQYRKDELYDYESEGARSHAPPQQVSAQVPDGEDLISLNCPQCGAPLDSNKKIPRQTCPYCGALLIVK